VLWTVLGLGAFALVAFALAVRWGEQPLSLEAAFGDAASNDAAIFFSLRLPRALLAGIVGAALAASGCVLQALLRNPLADPFVLGVSGGAALGATLALVLGVSVLGDAQEGARSWVEVSAPSAFAFAGSVVATALVFGASGAAKSPYAALLTGVIFNAFASAVITCIKTLSAPSKVGELLYWLAGAIGYERHSTLVLSFVLQAVAIGVMWLLAGRINLLSLGDEEAASLGVPVERTRLLLLLAASISVAGAVAVSGLVGFVGLIVPHVLRLLLGPDQRLLVPASALGGAAFLMLSDLLARLSFSAFNAEPPVGVITAVLGGPMFLVLLRRERWQP
jgi:iron complex transport system permease protein